MNSCKIETSSLKVHRNCLQPPRRLHCWSLLIALLCVGFLYRPLHLFVMTDTTQHLTSALQSTHLSSSSPHPSALPRTLTRSFSVDGIPTHCWVQVFANRIVIGLSQLDGRLSNYLLCEAIPDPVHPKSIEYATTTLLGARDEAVWSVYARQVTQRMVEYRHPVAAEGESFPVVVLGLGLRPATSSANPNIFRAMVDVMVQVYIEAVSNTSSG